MELLFSDSVIIISILVQKNKIVILIIKEKSPYISYYEISIYFFILVYFLSLVNRVNNVLFITEINIKYT